MHDFSIKKAEVNDLPAIYEVQLKSFGEDLLEPVEKFERIFNAYPDAYFIAEIESEVIGYVIAYPADDAQKDYDTRSCTPSSEHVCLYIHDLCVAPLGQGKGLARALFLKVESFAIDHKFQKLIGVAVQDSVPFWNKLGFDMLYPHSYCGEDGQFMQKEL